MYFKVDHVKLACRCETPREGGIFSSTFRIQNGLTVFSRWRLAEEHLSAATKRGRGRHRGVGDSHRAVE